MSTRSTNREFVFVPNEYPLTPGTRLIEASAGTGKTFALAHIVMRLVTENKLLLKNILVVTFTDSSASELRSRIGRRLEQTLNCLEAIRDGNKYDTPDDVLKEWLLDKCADLEFLNPSIGCLLEALENISTVDITTIHGFCRRTLSRDTLFSQDLINPGIETESNDILIEIAYDYISQNLLNLNVDDFRGLQESGFNLDSLVEAILKLDSEPGINIEKSDNCFELSFELVDQFNNRLELLWNNFLIKWQSDGEDLELSLRAYAKYWRELGFKDTKPFSPKPRTDRYSKLCSWIRSIDTQFIPDSNQKKLSYGVLRDQQLLINYFHPSIFFDLASRLGENISTIPISELQNSIASLLDEPAEKVWNHALQWCMDALQKRRSERRIISYSGMLKKLSEGLERNPLEAETKGSSWLEIIRSRYTVALIDEFQDTDQTQWHILNTIFSQSDSHLLLMVGDPKQAIYRFRGGSLDVYMNVRRVVSRIDFLLENYRTTPKLMESINNILSVGLRYSNLEVPALRASGETLDIQLRSDRKPLQLLTLDEDYNETKSIPSKTRLEELIPKAVANCILDLLDYEKEQFCLSDICIIVSKHSQAESIRSALANVGLSSKLVNSGDVFQSEAANSLQKFLDCIAWPGHSGYLRLLACSPLYDWNASMLKAAESNGELDNLAERFSYLSNNFTRLGLLGCLTDHLEARKLADLSETGRFLGDLFQCAQLVQEQIKID